MLINMESHTHQVTAIKSLPRLPPAASTRITTDRDISSKTAFLQSPTEADTECTHPPGTHTGATEALQSELQLQSIYLLPLPTNV